MIDLLEQGIAPIVRGQSAVIEFELEDGVEIQVGEMFSFALSRTLEVPLLTIADASIAKPDARRLRVPLTPSQTKALPAVVCRFDLWSSLGADSAPIASGTVLIKKGSRELPA